MTQHRCPWCDRLFPSLGEMVARRAHDCTPAPAESVDGTEPRARFGNSTDSSVAAVRAQQGPVGTSSA